MTSSPSAATNEAFRVVRDALLKRGPSSSQGLHAYLHSLPSPLPARLPPADFLSSPSRPLQSLAKLEAKQSKLAFPGKRDSTGGKWSMRYLKRQVLDSMQEEGEILKITKARWDSLKQPLAENRGPEAGNIKVSETYEGGEEQGLATTSRKDDGDFVWILKTQVDETIAAQRRDRQQARKYIP
ncbi:hypothetical protein JCM16303_006022 [Sporobolomyces ruberrimus]